MDDDAQLQRRIELQDHQDLAYLLSNVRDAATARINEAFPQIAGQTGKDDLRTQIEALVNDVRTSPSAHQPSPRPYPRRQTNWQWQYINETFSLAAPNLSINGLDVRPDSFLQHQDDSDAQSYEPFDTEKRRKVANLIAQEEKLLEEVAALKRSIPAEAAEQHANHIDDMAKRDEQLFQDRLAGISSGANVQFNVAALDRQDGVEAQFRTAVEALERLKRDMPSVVAKMDRARVAGEYVVNDVKS